MKFLQRIQDARATLVGLFAPRDSNLEQSLSQTREVEKQLKRSVHTFEREFLQVLNSLEDLQSTGEQLSTQSAAMLALNQSESNPINSISRKLEPNLDFIESSAHEIESLVEILAKNRSQIDATLKFETQLKHTFSQLTYIRTLFAVEAAPLDQNAKVMFTSLVEEIHRLQKDVTAIFTDNFQSLRKHAGTIAQLEDSLAQKAGSQLSLHASSKSDMQDKIESQTESLARVITSNSEMKSHGDRIAQSIGTAIISLQTQDIVSQVIQHIFETSEDMRKRFVQTASIKDKQERATALRFIENAALIVANQIESVKMELQLADKSIDRSVGEIADAIHAMESSTAATLKSSGRSGSNESAGQNLIGALKSAGRIVGDTASFLTQAFTAIEPIRGQTSNVSSTVMTLSSQLHLIGLNAEIHAARTGGSTALETLSAETSAISVETRDLCKRISKQLDQLADALHENVNIVESVYQAAGTAHEQILKDIPSEIQNLEVQDTSYEHSLSEAERLVDKLRDLARNQDARLEFEATMMQELEAMQSVQREISSHAKKNADRLKIDVDVPTTMSCLLDRYSMNSEKLVHRQTLGLGEASVNREPSFDEASFEKDVFFGFDAERETAPAGTKETEEFGENVQLF